MLTLGIVLEAFGSFNRISPILVSLFFIVLLRYNAMLFTFWTQLAYLFNRRTAGPLGHASAPGWDEPTSRCQTAPSMWTIGRYKPVIPGVTFIRKRCRYHTHVQICTDSGKLTPTFVPARVVTLTVKLAYAYTLSIRFPSESSQPLNASGTFWEATAPVKLSTRHGPRPWNYSRNNSWIIWGPGKNKIITRVVFHCWLHLS